MGRAEDAVLPHSLHSQPEVKEHFQRGALIAWCFHPEDEGKKQNKKGTKLGITLKSCQKKNKSVGDPAHILATVNELIYGYYSVFVLIHFLWETERKEKMEKQTKRGGLLKCPVQQNEVEPHTCLKEYFYMLTRCLLFEDRVCAFTHHVIDGLHNVQHFLRTWQKRFMRNGKKAFATERKSSFIDAFELKQKMPWSISATESRLTQLTFHKEPKSNPNLSTAALVYDLKIVRRIILLLSLCIWNTVSLHWKANEMKVHHKQI